MPFKYKRWCIAMRFHKDAVARVNTSLTLTTRKLRKQVIQNIGNIYIYPGKAMCT